MPLKGKPANNKLKGSTIQAGNVSGWTDSQNNVARQCMYYLMAGGLSKAGASGMIGNWVQESGLNPASPGGYLGQWIGSRASNLQTFASQSGLAVTSVEAQCRFALHELRTDYPGLYSYLQSATDPKVAALRISHEYERPAAFAANNAGRQQYAAQAYAGLTGASGYAADGSGQGGSGGGGSSAPGSILDLLTSPVSTLGGWLASIAVDLVKDTAIGIADVIIIPAFHWQQRSVMAYQQAMFQSGNFNQLLWTGTFWGLGYWLLFTDPGTGHLKPAPVRNSRLTRHARFGQSLPARHTLIKPKDVKSKTPRKPKPVTSRAVVSQTGTMSTNRPQTVRVSGYRANSHNELPSRSESRFSKGSRPESPWDNATHPANGKPNTEYRAGGNSRNHRRGNSKGGSGESSGTGSES